MNNREDIKEMEKQINNKTTGMAIIIAAIAMGTILMLFPQLFGDNIVTRILQWSFILLGFFGIIGEFCSTKKEKTILGIDEIVIGLFFCMPSLICMYFKTPWWVNCTLLLVSFFGSDDDSARSFKGDLFLRTCYCGS